MTPHDVAASSQRWTCWGWALAGLTLIAIHVVLFVISPQFAYGELAVLERLTGLMVALLMLAGAVYLAVVWILLRAFVEWRRDDPRANAPLRVAAKRGHHTHTRGWWIWIILVGLAMRSLMFTSTPMLETDYYRYLWDGAVTAHGHNPYAHALEAILGGRAPDEIMRLSQASDEAAVVLARVNHAWLTTIYPPTAQAGFALGHIFMPWRIEGLRIVWFGLDVVTLVLLLGLLRELRMPAAAVVIYWWNPLLIKEGYNSAHMEMTFLPIVVAALWLAVRYRLLASAVALAFAAGAKIWPALLLPALLRQQPSWQVTWKRTTLAAVVFVALSAAILSPMLLAAGDEPDAAGVTVYAATWQMNDTLYQGFHLLGSWLAPEGASPGVSHRIARLMVGVVLLGLIAWLCRRPAMDGVEVCERALWIVAGLFLLSPTQYPWYWLWLLPMLVVRPSPGLLVLTMTLPLYYLRFPMRELGLAEWFNNGVVWLQFAPCFALLLWEARRRLQRSAVSVS